MALERSFFSIKPIKRYKNFKKNANLLAIKIIQTKNKKQKNKTNRETKQNTNKKRTKKKTKKLNS